MEKNLKPHYTLILISTLKMTFILALCYIAAVAVSPNKYYSALNLLKMFIPAAVLIYAYMFYFWNSVSICFNNDKLIFNMTAGRKNHIEVLYSEITHIKTTQGILEKLFGVSRISITIGGDEKTYGSSAMVLENYLVFKNETTKEVINMIKANA